MADHARRILAEDTALPESSRWDSAPVVSNVEDQFIQQMPENAMVFHGAQALRIRTPADKSVAVLEDSDRRA
jgi:hypothetical protein